MILEDIQIAIKAALDADPYFRVSPAVVVLVERQPSIRNDLQAALNGAGAAVVVTRAKLRRAAAREFTARFDLAVLENVLRNSEAGGTAKTAERIAGKAWTILEGASLLEGAVNFRVATFEQADSGDGIVEYELGLEADMILSPEEALLGTQGGLSFENEEGVELTGVGTPP